MGNEEQLKFRSKIKFESEKEVATNILVVLDKRRK